MTYQELKNKHQKEVNDFPLGFAFNDKQFEEMMKTWSLDATSKEDLHKIISLGSGAFIRKQDVKAFNEMATRHEAELKELWENEQDLIEAMVYQLHNHEYGYSRDTDDMEAALAALGMTWDDVDAQNNPFHHKCLVQAERRCVREYLEMN